MLTPLVLVPLFLLSAAPQGSNGARFGQAVAAADVNGDGFDDVIVGEPGYSGALVEQGRVLVYLGSITGPSSTPAWVHPGPQARAHFGATLANAGDLNGDGREDVVIGMPDYDGLRQRIVAGPGAAARFASRQDAGLVSFFLGTPTGLTSTPTGYYVGREAGERVSAAVAGAGDVNNDGLADVIVGAPGTLGERGAVHLFLGSTGSSGPALTPAATLLGPAGAVSFGSAVAGGEDIDGDGLDDVLVGAPDGGTNGGGAAYLHRGLVGGLETSALWSRLTDGPESDYGVSVAMGDVALDEVVELLVGDPLKGVHSGFEWMERVGEVEVVIYLGAYINLPYPFFPLQNVANAYHGQVLSTPGDLNGDGQLECAPGAAGAVAVPWLPDPDSIWFAYDYIQYGSQSGEAFGSAVAIGNVDGNAYDDLIVGAPLFDTTAVNAGRVYVFSGSPTVFTLPPAHSWTLQAP